MYLFVPFYRELKNKAKPKIFTNFVNSFSFYLVFFVINIIPECPIGHSISIFEVGFLKWPMQEKSFYLCNWIEVASKNEHAFII